MPQHHQKPAFRAQHTICPGCGVTYGLRRADLGRRSVCRNCGQAFYLLPPSDSPPTVILQGEPGEDAPHLVGRLWLDLRTGQILDGDFLVRRPLGRGGLSQVFQVLDLKRNQDLAVKLPLAATLDRLPQEIFLNEALAWLKPALHPNLVACDQVRLYQGQPVIFMEYIQGLDLSRLAAAGRGILYQGPPRASCLRLLDIFIQVARGLGYAHSLGLNHLDLKPRNILVENGGRALIGDYGPLSDSPEPPSALKTPELDAGENQETRISGTRLLGTPQYFSPEAAAGRSGRGTDADLWALALSILECFLGRRPWEMGSLAGLALGQYLAEDQRPTYLPPGLAEYFQKALAKDPAGRFRDAGDVVARLTGIYQEVAGRPYGRPEAHPKAETPERSTRKNASFRELGRLSLLL